MRACSLFMKALAKFNAPLLPVTCSAGKGQDVKEWKSEGAGGWDGGRVEGELLVYGVHKDDYAGFCPRGVR